MKRYTTGEMIDRLKVYEIAESNNRRVYFENHQLVSESKTNGVKAKFTISSGDRGRENWTITPIYVSFASALKAYKEGRVINSWLSDGEVPYYRRIPKKSYLSLNKFELVGEEVTRFDEFKWSIE